MVRAPEEMLYRYEPDHAVPPGETLREVLADLDMTQAELARRTGLTAKTVNQIAQGVAPLTHETALSLEKVTGVPARIWNSLEAQWQEHLAREEEDARLVEDAEWLETLPIDELKQRGWLPKHHDVADLVRAVCKFFGVANRQAWHDVWHHPKAAFRRSKKFSIEEGATAAWLRIGEIKAREVECESYNASLFKRNLAEIRRLTASPVDVFENQIVELCAEAGVALVFVPEIQGTRANGATRWLSRDKALMQLSLRYKREDVFWFSLFHEAGHILLHGKRNLFVETKRGDTEDTGEGLFADDQVAEGEADAFARDFLIPPERNDELRNLRYLDEVRNFAHKLGIAPAIVVGRLQHEGILDWSVGNKLIRRFEFAEYVR